MNRIRAVFLLLLLGLALGGCGRKTALTLPPDHSVTPAAPTAPDQNPTSAEPTSPVQSPAVP
ncbi:LPS translocon maturation chaperone LptM [Acidithiobacillus sp.]|uniref:LPS translocon maturation chaperone LptM n=1 Tax=Acidithiobacillus sp. TaxID=1872118 RepID=UPI003CFCB4BA